jgi:protein TonB
MFAAFLPRLVQKFQEQLTTRTIIVEMSEKITLPEETVKTIPPPVKQIEPPKPPKATTAYTPPAIVDDSKEESKLPTNEELDKTDIANKTSEASDKPEIPTVDNGDADKFTPSVVEPEKPDQILEFVEQAAEFPGGTTALMKWLSESVVYPSYAREVNIKGRVVVKFVVEKDGKIGNVKILKGVHDLLDNEALRVVKKMPNWKAGKQGGNTVRCYFTLPINFTLE